MIAHEGVDGVPRYVYAGVSFDAAAITEKSDPMNPFTQGSFLLVFDFPFSFVADTVVFPYDICMVTFGGKDRNGQDRRSGQQTTMPESKPVP